MQNLNEELRNAISYRDIKAVEKYLIAGADANHITDFSEFGTDNSNQPTTPLSLVVFCISDCLLEDKDLVQFEAIAKLLLKYGADPKPAMELSEIRYGKYDPTMKGFFMNVLHVIANAQKYT